MSVVLTIYLRFDADRKDSDAYFWLLSALTLMNPIQNAISLVIFWQKDDIQQTFYRYSSKIKAKRPKSAWRQNDTYECDGGDLRVVTYCNAEGLPIDGDEGDDDDSDGDAGMPMWMSMSFRSRNVT